MRRKKTKKFAKIIILVLILALLIGVGYIVFSKISEKRYITEVKKGWYVEITSDYINLRKDCNASSKKIGEVKKGGIYKVYNVNLETPGYFFYEIQVDKKTRGWIASSRKNPFVKDVNNPTDIQVPTIRFFSDTYEVFSIDKITYDHLEITDDRNDWVVTSEVYHELKPAEDINQYWIKYTVTDATGKSSSKVQKIVFDVAPPEDKVLSFTLLRNN